jgi:Tfp pilus assembly protein PilZ
MMSNSRLSERAPFVSEVDVLKMGDELPRRMWGKNLSETGVFLQTTATFSPGERVSLRFAIDGADVHVRAAEVVWVKRFEPISVDGVLPGVGIRFLAVDPPTRAAIRTFVHDEVAPPGPIEESSVPPVRRENTQPYGFAAPEPEQLTPQADSLLSDIPIDSLPPLEEPSAAPSPFDGWRFERNEPSLPEQQPPSHELGATLEEPALFDDDDELYLDDIAATAESPLPDFSGPVFATTEEDEENPTVSLRVSKDSEVPAPPEDLPSFADSLAAPLPLDGAVTDVDLARPELESLPDDEPVFASTIGGLELPVKESISDAFFEDQAGAPQAEPPPAEISEPAYVLRGPRGLKRRPSDDADAAIARADASVLEIEERLSDEPGRRRPWMAAAIVCVGVGIGAFLGWDQDPPAPAPAASNEVVMPAPRAVAAAERPLKEPAAPSGPATTSPATKKAPATKAPASSRSVAEAKPKPQATPKPKPLPRKAEVTPVNTRPAPAAGSGIEFGRMAVPLKGGKIVKKFGLTNPSRVVVDLVGAEYPGARNEPIGEKGIAKLRIGRPDTERIRVVIELSRDGAPRNITAVKRGESLVVAWK